MAGNPSANSEGQADSTEDNYGERVLRNEGKLIGLEQLVSETRAADQKLVDFKSDSIAIELERTRVQLRELSNSERSADLREHRDARAAITKNLDDRLRLIGEMYDERIRTNYEQSRDALNALEERTIARTIEARQEQRLIHRADQKALVKSENELARRLDVLNHAHEKQIEFQNQSVTRELYQADKDAQAQRETVLRDSITATEHTCATKIGKDEAEQVIASSLAVRDSRIGVLNDKVTKLESYVDVRTGTSKGYAALYGWTVGAFGLLISVIVAANAIFGK